MGEITHKELQVHKLYGHVFNTPMIESFTKATMERFS